MDEEFIAKAARYFANECEKTGHLLASDSIDGTCPCMSIAARLEASRDTLLRAQTFDVGREALSHSSTFPDLRWPISALARDVSDSLLTPPWSADDDVQRMVWVTSELARLGEHGIPPDGFVRVGLRSQIKHQIAGLSVAVSMRLKTSPGLRNSIPDRLSRWTEVLDSCADQARDWSDDGQDLVVRLSRAVGGDFAGVVESWLASASIKDIVAWNYDAEPHQILDDGDLGFPGGVEVMDWIVDRFTKTRYADWKRTSLYWELRFASNPAVTSVDSGVALSILDERPAHITAITDAIVTRASRLHVDERVIANMSFAELPHYVLMLISNDVLDQAIELLREAVGRYPDMPGLRNILGFCLIPVNPTAALAELNNCVSGDMAPLNLIQANRVAALWRSGRRTEARAIGLELLRVGPVDEFVLWCPSEIIRLQMNVSTGFGNYRVDRWLTELLAF